jgi:uncharacterized delta-60 repeat protein
MKVIFNSPSVLRSLTLAAMAGAGVAVVVACGDDDSPAADPVPAPTSTATTTPDAGGVPDSSTQTDAADAGEALKPVVLALPQSGHARLFNVTYGPDGSLWGLGQAGSTGTPSDLALLLVKILPSGQLDTTFNSTGYVIQNVATGLGGETFRGITIQTQGANAGKIVVAGVGEHDQTDAASPTRDVVVVRFNTNGTLDNGFGTNGVARFPLGDGTGVQQWDLERFANDDLLITAARAPVTTDYDAAAPLPARQIVAMKLNGTDGTLVDNFGQDSDGVWRLPFPWNVNPRTATVLSDGTAIVAGYRAAGGGGPPNRAVIAKLTTTGVLDTTFGSGGIFFPETEPPGFGAGAIIEAYGAVPQGSKFVTTGYGKESSSNTVDGWVSLRLLENGTLDSTYGNNGHVFFTVNDQNANSRSLFVLPDQRIVLLGGASPPKPASNSPTQAQHAAIMILQPNGQPDPTFSAPLPKMFDFGGPAIGRANHFFWAGAVSPDQKQAAIVGIKGGNTASDAGPAGVDQAVVLFMPTGK